MHHVSRCVHVLVPTRGTDAWLDVAAAVMADSTLEDTNTIIGNDDALAVWLAFQADIGNFTDLVQACDTVVVECSDFECPPDPITGE